MKGILSNDEIKEADEFFASSTGQKLSQAILFQLGMGEAPTGEPTAEEKVKRTKAMTKPFFVKMQSHQDAMSEEEAIAFMTSMIQKEIECCQISE